MFKKQWSSGLDLLACVHSNMVKEQPPHYHTDGGLKSWTPRSGALATKPPEGNVLQ